jgi:hypothetical protein
MLELIIVPNVLNSKKEMIVHCTVIFSDHYVVFHLYACDVPYAFG